MNRLPLLGRQVDAELHVSSTVPEVRDEMSDNEGADHDPGHDVDLPRLVGSATTAPPPRLAAHRPA
jgi:hypothetical protein